MFDALPPPSFWYGLRGKTRTNLILFVGAARLAAFIAKRRKNSVCARNVVLMLVLLRAHTEVRPYRLIVPVVLHFLLVLALASGEAERGEARRGLSREWGYLARISQIITDKLIIPSIIDV